MKILKAFQEDAKNNAVDILSSCLSDIKQLDKDLNYDKYRNYIISKKGCILFEAPTGIGKTLITGKTAEDISAKNKIIWVWLAPFTGVIEQSRKTIKTNFFGLQVRDIINDRHITKLKSGDTFVTTWSSLAMSNKEARKARQSTETLVSFDDLIQISKSNGFNIGVIIDEAHHSFKTGTQSSDFYKDVLNPDITILCTATPKDKDIELFERKTSITVNRISISRKQGVETGLLKAGIKVGLFRTSNLNDSQFIDFEHTALMQGIYTHKQLKEMLKEQNVSFTPLLLVQATDNDNIERIKKWALKAGFSNESISVHTADEPDPYLETIAYDNNIEILIFKLAVATGFDIPRAFTLVSFRTNRDSDFGTQIIGRIMRVHQDLQGHIDSIPEQLKYGYVFLSNKDGQTGLVNAAQRINSIKDELAIVSGNIMVVPMTSTLSKIDITGQTELIFNIEDNEDVELNLEINDKTTYCVENQPDLFGNIFFSSQNKSYNKTVHPNSNNYSQPIIYEYHIKEEYNVPKYFKTAQLGVNGLDIIDDAITFFEIDNELLAIAQKQAIQIKRENLEIFSGKYDSTESSYAYILEKEITKRGQASLIGINKNGLVNVKNLQLRLESRLKKAFEDAGILDIANDEKKVRNGLYKILSMKKSRLDEAIKRAMLKHIEEYNAEPLPISINSDIELEYSRRNIYGVIPPDLGSWEIKFASWLDDNEANNINWWYRNPSRKPYSVCIPIPGRTNKFYPDFIISVENRNKKDGIILIDTKERINDEEGIAVSKINATHPTYGKAIIIYLQEGKEDSKWYTVRYIESKEKNELDQILRYDLLSIL